MQSDFLKDRSGNIAITAAAMIMTLALLCGVALDYARGVRAKRLLQAATDIATMAVAMRPPNQDATALARKMLDANATFAPQIVSLDAPSSSTAKSVRLLTRYELPTILMGLFGQPVMTVDALSEVTLRSPKLHVALVLDNSGSMNLENRIGNLKAAATDAVNTMMAKGDGVKIGLVPFNLAVNVGPQYKTASWINDAAPSPNLVAAQRKDNKMSSTKRFDLFDAMNLQWAGCVEARTNGHDVTDTPPTSDETKFVPTFAPDDPGAQPNLLNTLNVGAGLYNSDATFANNYISDDGDCKTAASSQSVQGKQTRTCKYFKTAVNSSYNSWITPHLMGPNLLCTAQPVTRLTSTKSTLTTAISAMTPDGGTNIAEGVGWGFRILSDKAPFADGLTSAERASGGRRVMIVMTDGDNQIMALNNFNGSSYSPHGFIIEGRLGNVPAGALYENIGFKPLNEKMLATCKNAKDAGIEIFTIGVSITTPEAVTALKTCASDPAASHAYQTSSGGLSDVFKSIVAQIDVPYYSQ